MNAEDCIFFQIAKVNQKAMRFWSKKISHLNITPVQGILLFFLSEDDGVTSNSLGERVQLDSATLTGVFDRLESAGLIERRPKPGDRRAVLLFITEKGREAADGIREIAVAANLEFLSALSAKEMATFVGMLNKIRGR